MSVSLIVCRDPDELATVAAEGVVGALGDARRREETFSLALSGGSTPLATYRKLAEASVDWSRVRLLFGDERFVPRDDPESNYRSAREHLIDPAEVPASSVFPVPTDLPTADASARAYEATLQGLLGSSPRLDLALLGLGEDGHTASLFPGSTTLESRRWVVAASPGTLPPHVERVTLTLRALDAARHVLFLVQGAEKADVLRQVLEPEEGRPTLPAAQVLPSDGDVVWLVDRDAAQLLHRTPRLEAGPQGWFNPGGAP